MPSSSHIGVSLKIEEEAERERLKQAVTECLASEGLEEKGGFIIRTATEGADMSAIMLDIRYLHRLWEQVREHMQSGWRTRSYL